MFAEIDYKTGKIKLKNKKELFLVNRIQQTRTIIEDIINNNINIRADYIMTKIGIMEEFKLILQSKSSYENLVIVVEFEKGKDFKINIDYLNSKLSNLTIERLSKNDYLFKNALKEIIMIFFNNKIKPRLEQQHKKIIEQMGNNIGNLIQ